MFVSGGLGLGVQNFVLFTSVKRQQETDCGPALIHSKFWHRIARFNIYLPIMTATSLTEWTSVKLDVSQIQ